MANTEYTELVIEDLGFDQLKELGSELRREQRRVAKGIAMVEGEIIRRMKTEGSQVKFTSDGGAIKLEVASLYEWDLTALVQKFQPMIAPALWEKNVRVTPPPPPKPDYKISTTGLLALAKKMGPEAESTLAECYRKIEGNPKVNFVDPDPEDMPL